MGKDSSAEAVSSKKPQWNGNTPNTESAKPTSPLAKQKITSTPGITKRETAGIEGTALTEAEGLAMLEGEATGSHLQKVRRLPVIFRVKYLSWYLAQRYLSSGGCHALILSPARGVSMEPALAAA